MTDQPFWTIKSVTGIFLVVGFAANLAGVLMFLYRGGLQGTAPPSAGYYAWERSFLTAAVVLTAIGLVLLESYLQNTPGHILARVGATTYLFGAVFIVIVEALSLSQGNVNTYPLVVIYVVLALLAQAVIGAALLQSGLLPAWVGWVAIVWNIAFLAILPITSPRDMYYPFVHHVVPVVIGIVLLQK
jgi:hypothetical protein